MAEEIQKVEAADVSNGKTKLFTMRWDPAMFEAVKAQAALEERSIAGLISYLVRCYLEKQK